MLRDVNRRPVIQERRDERVPQAVHREVHARCTPHDGDEAPERHFRNALARLRRGDERRAWRILTVREAQPSLADVTEEDRAQFRCNADNAVLFTLTVLDEEGAFTDINVAELEAEDF